MRGGGLGGGGFCPNSLCLCSCLVPEENKRKKHPFYRRVPPCAAKTCAVRPVFARLVWWLRAADPSNVQGPVKQNASPGEQSEAPRPRWKPGQEQNPGPENQDSQHMLEQPRGKTPILALVENQPRKSKQARTGRTG